MLTYSSRVVKIALFIDGVYFKKVSNYYLFQHKKKSGICFKGLAAFLRHEVSVLEGIDDRSCQIVEKHFYIGRYSTQSTIEKGYLEKERRYEELLINNGIEVHYLPIDGRTSVPTEKGVDVSLALEAYKLAIEDRYDILILLTGDGDFVPLIENVKKLGKKVMLLSWCLKYEVNGLPKEIRTSSRLRSVADYPLMMHNIMESDNGDLWVLKLFAKNKHWSNWRPCQRF